MEVDKKSKGKTRQIYKSMRSSKVLVSGVRGAVLCTTKARSVSIERMNVTTWRIEIFSTESAFGWLVMS
jgi:hypothetical protein